MLDRVLTTIEEEILPQTKTQLAKGNKMFGAAVLDAFSGDTVVAATNLETACPIHHGEVVAIEAWSSLKKRPRASECLFVATHEPCCLCVSAIVWSGFERCVFLFPYETTKRQGIPHDLNIMYELWRVERYQRRNRYLATSGVSTLIAALPPSSERADLEARVSKPAAAYDARPIPIKGPAPGRRVRLKIHATRRAQSRPIRKTFVHITPTIQHHPGSAPAILEKQVERDTPPTRSAATRRIHRRSSLRLRKRRSMGR